MSAERLRLRRIGKNVPNSAHTLSAGAPVESHDLSTLVAAGEIRSNLKWRVLESKSLCLGFCVPLHGQDAASAAED